MVRSIGKLAVCGMLGLFWSWACVAGVTDKMTSPMAERLLFEQSGANRDHTLKPFSIEVGIQPDNASRDVVFVTAEAYENILTLIRSAEPALRGNTAPNALVNGFEVRDFHKDGSREDYHVSDRDTKTVMRDIIESFNKVNKTTPPWILSIEGAL